MGLLTQREMELFEELFYLNNGFVLNMNKKELGQFIYQSIDIDINEESFKKKVESQYQAYSMKRIYQFIVKFESKSKSLKFLSDLIDYIDNNDLKNINENLLIKAKTILNKYSNSTYPISPYDTAEKDIIGLVENINQMVEEGRPQYALEQLHTYLIHYLRYLCQKHEIEYEKEERLDKLFKEYLKSIEDYIETDLSKSILKQTISMLSEFNKVRNNNSPAHARSILTDAEALLIFRNFTNIFEFIKSIENNIV